MATARPRLLPQPENCLRTSQLRFTRIAPEVPPCLARETEGAALVSVTLDRRTGAVGGAGGCTAAGGPTGGARGTGGPEGGGIVTGGATGGCTVTGGAGAGA